MEKKSEAGAAAGKTAQLYRSVTGMTERSFLVMLLAIAAAGAAGLHSRYYVGFFNDDANFILLARSLWQHLGSLSGGFGGAFSHFLPGYPLFLMPFAAAFEPHWSWLRWTTAGVSLLTVYAFWKLLEGWLGEEERRWASLLYAAHPLFALCSGMVMADPLLACLFVLGLLGFRRSLEGKGAPATVLMIGACIFATAVKPIGLLLPLALTAALPAAGARRQLRLLGLLFWLPCIAAAAYAAFSRHNPTDYITYMLQGLAWLSGQPPLQRLYTLLHSFVLVCGLGWFWPRGGMWDLSGSLLIAGVLYLCARGAAALLSGADRSRYAAAAACGLLLGQGIVMSLWTVYSERYALPMLPLALLFFSAGATAAWRGRPWAARALLGALAAGFMLHTVQLALVTNSERAPMDGRLCARTLEWIRRETPPESRFVGSSPLVALYTGRAGDGLFGARDFDLFLTALSRSGITHALVTDLPVLSARGSYANDHALQKRMERAWITGHPKYFSRLFSDAAEHTAVYSVSIPPGWGEAAGLYAAALAEVRTGRLAEGERDLRLALEAVPDFPSALTALAAVKMISGKDMSGAEKLLRRTLELEPDFPRASRMLFALLERGGRKTEAAKVREAALTSRSAVPFEVPEGSN
ncbi:MAG: hypothetical protein M0011_12800 [Elusimicrobia bacterium]|nr:hypothetical protein [Elusimicrobiota bacterium]